MASELLPMLARAADTANSPYSGAVWSFYVSGTSTPLAVYEDGDLSTSLGTTVTADGAGKFPAIYMDSDQSYRGVLKDSTGAVTLFDFDPINPGVLAQLSAPGGWAGIDGVAGFDSVITPEMSVSEINAELTSGAGVIGAAPGEYSVSGLTSSDINLTVSGVGRSTFVKNANGVLWTHDDNYGRFENLFLSGLGYTGANLYLTGSQTDLIFCNSQKAGSEALSSVGPPHIWGGVWESVNADTSIPDVRWGLAGTASLYGLMIGTRSTQPLHGVYEVDTGSTFMGFNQIGNLTIDNSGTVVGAINGGHRLGNRFTGSIICNISTSTWAGNLVADGYHVTFGSGTSSHSFGIASNQVSPTGNVNNLGNNSSDICVNRGDGTRGLGGPCYAFGASGPSAQGAGAELWVGVAASAGAPDTANGSFGTPGYWIGEYNKGFRSRGSTSSNIYNVAVVYASGGSITIGHGTAAATTIISAGTGGVLSVVANTTITRTTATAFMPDDNGTTALGGASNRWSEVFAATGTINTSDADLKEQIGDIPDAWLDAWGEVQWQRFKMKDAVAEKGEDARWHIGLIAQEVRDAFIAHSLDATEIGLLCFDEWEAEAAEEEVWQEEYTDDAGNVYPRTLLSPAKAAREAGSTWGLRYAECQAMEAAYQRRRSDALEARLAALEAA